jgi:hypothetical protein
VRVILWETTNDDFETATLVKSPAERVGVASSDVEISSILNPSEVKDEMM